MVKINNRVFTFVLLVLGLVASAMIFLPALIYQDTDTVFTGVEAVFGTEFASLGIFGSGQMEPSFLGIVAFILPGIAGILGLVFSKKTFVSFCLFIAAAILLFLLPTYAQATITVLGETSTLDVSWTMGSGVIIAICASIVGAVTSVLQILVPKP